MRATTDSLREIRFDPLRPGVSNLLILSELFTGHRRSAIEAQFAGKGYAELKHELAEVIIAALQPLQARYRQLVADAVYLTTLLATGVERVFPRAEKTLTLAKEHLGLGEKIVSSLGVSR